MRIAPLLVLLLALCSFSHALIHHLEIRGDSRHEFFIESFGFEAGGTLDLKVSNFQLSTGEDFSRIPVGFVLKRTQTETSRFLEENEGATCLYNVKLEDVFEKKVPLVKPDTSFVMTVRPDATGFYNVYFTACVAADTSVSFDLDLVMYNPGPNYLSIGQSVEPMIFSFFFFIYLVLCAMWICSYMRGGSDGRKVLLVHYLMTALLIIKTFALLFHAIELHYLKISGHAGGWEYMFYILQFLKGTGTILLIALIGTGWAFFKPFLSDRDKRIILIVVPLQIIDNLALIYIEAEAPGSQEWITWQDIFRLVDILCCIMILVPIIWSIRHLKEASTIDGKAAVNLKKLVMFRHYYLLVVSYVYFTRIIVFLLEASLRLRWTWVSVFVTEVATLCFYCITGYLFSPVADNPYLKMDSEDVDIVIDGIEMEPIRSEDEV